MFLQYVINKTGTQNYISMCVYVNIYNWSSLFIFNIYASAYLLKFVIPILTLIACVVICRHEQNSDNLSHHMHPFSAEVELGDALPSCFSSHSINSLMVLLFFALLCLLGGGTLLLKMGPECSAKMLSSVPKCKKAMMCLMKKIHVR